MPIYEYQCRDCGKVTDVRHGFDETNTQTCPTCGGELARRFSAAGIVFKGSGFYKTDSRAAAAKSSGGKSESASADGGTADSAKADKPSTASTTSSATSDTGKSDTAAA